VSFCNIVTADDGTSASAELSSLAENFREQAAMLVDMLDISIPMVAKLKVNTVCCTSSVLLIYVLIGVPINLLVRHFNLCYC